MQYKIMRGRPKYIGKKRYLKYYFYDICPTLTENCAAGDQKNIIMYETRKNNKISKG